MAVALIVQEVRNARNGVVDEALTDRVAYPQVVADLGQCHWQGSIINATLQSRLGASHVLVRAA